MASPFTIFRRNQKILLAIVGIAAMIAFVFLDPVMRYFSGPVQQENPVVVETNYGNLTRDQLENLEYQRELVNQFLQRVAQQVVISQVGQGNVDSRLVDNLVEQNYRFWFTQLMQRSEPGREAAAVETMLLAERAKQAGLVVSDQAINDFLKQLTMDSVSSEELQKIIQGLQPSRPVSVARLFEAIRTEMLASQYSQMFMRSMGDVPPQQRFEYYSRLNRQANAEVLALAVADFVGQVPEPSDAEVKKLYDQHKNDFPNPDSPEPGFKQPPRATVQYFKADVGALAKKLAPDVTDEEIKKYYEDNKSQFRVFDLDEDPTAKDGGKSDEQSPAESPAADKPGEEKPTEEKPAAEKPAADAPAEADKPAEPKPDDKPAEPAPQSSRHQPGESVIRLVSAQAEAQPAPEQPAVDKPAAAANAADQPPAAEAPAAGQPADKPADATPAEAAAKSADSQPEAAAAKPEVPRFEPLEKVQDKIRESLALQKSTQRVGEQFEELQAVLRRYADELDLYNTEKGVDPKLKPPVPLDFAKLAEGKDVVPGELQSATAAEAAKTDIGKAFRIVPNQRLRTVNTVPFFEFALSDALPLYKAELVQDNDNNAYLAWKTAEEPAFVPPLDQVRDKVVRAWKMIKARDLARKRAEEYAVQARALKKPLKDLFGTQPNLQIAETGPFTWLTLGNVPSDPAAQPRLSEVPGVDRPGAEFMKTVFGLEPGGIGVAANEPQDLVYVIRAIDFKPPIDELRNDFARENPMRYMAAARDERYAIYQAWLNDLKQQAGVHWLRQADARSRQEDEGAL